MNNEMFNFLIQNFQNCVSLHYSTCQLGLARSHWIAREFITLTAGTALVWKQKKTSVGSGFMRGDHRRGFSMYVVRKH